MKIIDTDKRKHLRIVQITIILAVVTMFVLAFIVGRYFLKKPQAVDKYQVNTTLGNKFITDRINYDLSSIVSGSRNINYRISRKGLIVSSIAKGDIKSEKPHIMFYTYEPFGSKVFDFVETNQVDRIEQLFIIDNEVYFVEVSSKANNKGDIGKWYLKKLDVYKGIITLADGSLKDDKITPNIYYGNKYITWVSNFRKQDAYIAGDIYFYDRKTGRQGLVGTGLFPDETRTTFTRDDYIFYWKDTRKLVQLDITNNVSIEKTVDFTLSDYTASDYFDGKLLMDNRKKVRDEDAHIIEYDLSTGKERRISTSGYSLYSGVYFKDSIWTLAEKRKEGYVTWCRVDDKKSQVTIVDEIKAMPDTDKFISDYRRGRNILFRNLHEDLDKLGKYRITVEKVVGKE